MKGRSAIACQEGKRWGAVGRDAMGKVLCWSRHLPLEALAVEVVLEVNRVEIDDR
jgi:hypothetical protein